MALRSSLVKSSLFLRFITKHLKNNSKFAGFKLMKFLVGKSGLILGRFSWRELLGVMTDWFTKSVIVTLDFTNDFANVT